MMRRSDPYLPNRSAMLRFSLVCFTVALILAGPITATTPKGTLTAEMCGPMYACVPWAAEKEHLPPCARRNRMPLSFMLDVAQEDNLLQWDKQVCGINTGPDTRHYVSYAFCPGIDTLQAFNLTSAGLIAGTTTNPVDGKLTLTAGDAWLRVYGLGTSNFVTVPQKNESEGAVQVIGRCKDRSLPFATNTDPLTPGSESNLVAIVPFLILNITMQNGRFRYYTDYPQPSGVGFASTCETTQGIDVCLLDSSMTCLGPPGRSNCAICYAESDVNSMANTNIQVWTSYFGTDRIGRQFRSGTNSPLNFREYAAGTLYTSMSASLQKVKSGEWNDDPDNIPDGGVGSF
jgi:hypothetical protein